jgi:hypothetical protein
MFETYPSKSHHGKYGKSSLPAGRGDGKTRYPSVSCNKQDDSGQVKLKYAHLNGASMPGDTYAKGSAGHKQFSNLEGLPS